MVSFIPTFKKAFYFPHEETVSCYAIGAVEFAIAIFALDSFSVTTVLYPAAVVTANSIFILMVELRKREWAISGVSLPTEAI